MEHIAPRIIGTAGHIDHGKSTLVRALTGIDPDRLPEEKARGITLDLGFAPVTLPGGIRAAFVDVPGHERFVRTMVAGATGVDAALLVVAADEGPMPQTREHLAILDLLGVESGVVALTKVDLVDAEWRDLVAQEVRQLLEGSALRGAPVVPVSARTGEGLETLRHALAEAVRRAPAKNPDLPCRLWVDRVFTVPGFGTVVTGTLYSGRVRVEDRLVVLPKGRSVRVRGIQVHGEPRQEAVAGERTALNLAGVTRQEVQRGDVVAEPGAVAVTRRLACQVRLIAGSGVVANGTPVHVHLGTAEGTGRLVWLDRDQAEGPGTYLARLTLRHEVPATHGQRLVVRGGSPLTTLGGGVVLDTAGERYRRGRSQSLARFMASQDGHWTDRLLDALSQAGLEPTGSKALAQRLGQPPEAVKATLQELVRQGLVVEAPGGGYLAPAHWRQLTERVQQLLAAYHRDHPVRPGMPREELRQRAAPSWDYRRFGAALSVWEAQGLVSWERDRVWQKGFDPWADAQVRAAAQKILATFAQAGLRPPGVREAAQGIPHGEEVVALLVFRGELVRVGEDLYLHPQALEEARRTLKAMLAETGWVTAASFRDRLGVSRKVAVPLLEWFDAQHLTQRQGDRHVAVGTA